MAVFALFLFLIQMLEGTALYFAAGTLAFLILSALTFNVAGGLSRVAGAYVFFYAMLVFIVGVCYKAVIGEPAESNLFDPHTTIKVYVGGMIAMLAAVLISRRFSRRTGLLQSVLPESLMYRACVGCLVFAIAGPRLIALLGGAGAKLASAFNQLNHLLPLAIIIGVVYEVRRSGGTRSINVPTLFAICYTFFIFGILGFSKQGMLEPVYCWVLAICAMRYRLSSLQLVGGAVGLLVIFEILVPYSQYGRRFITDTSSQRERLAVAVRLLSNPISMRNAYDETQDEAPNPIRYYNKPEGFWDRLTFIEPDDALINITDHGSLFGYLPVTASFVNAVPHFILPNKPVYAFGNMYAHQIGGLPDEDTTTGISFSPTAEAYHLDGWVSLMVVAPLVWSLMFIVLDALCGDLRSTPWGLLIIALLSHAAPELGLEGAIYMATFGAEIIIFCALFSRWVAPVVAVSVLGESKRTAFPLRLQPGFASSGAESAARSFE